METTACSTSRSSRKTDDPAREKAVLAAVKEQPRRVRVDVRVAGGIGEPARFERLHRGPGRAPRAPLTKSASTHAQKIEKRHPVLSDNRRWSLSQAGDMQARAFRTRR